jgi:hypothetical protein
MSESRSPRFSPGDIVRINRFGGVDGEVEVCAWKNAIGKRVEYPDGELFEVAEQQITDYGTGLLRDRVSRDRTTLFIKSNGCVGWGTTANMELVRKAAPKPQQLLLFEEAK